MGRSIVAMSASTVVEDFARRNQFQHAASAQRFLMIERGGLYYQRREMDGIEPVERQIHYVLGSGNHARAYLHQTEQGRLIQLPVAWYSADGGFWAMNPGYDRPDHLGFRRKLDGECLECHTNAGSSPPTAIGCGRCHGSSEDHSKLVNPAKLADDRRLEVCLQCHLQSTSHRLPYAVRRFDRAPFSFQPGQPLADSILHFDHAPGSAFDDKFEIAHSAYRLLKSACFAKSAGRLTCTTCHDPHDASNQRHRRACQACHPGAHRQGENCAVCHMPKRRTEDVVHVAMTDHLIQRRPPRDPLAPLAERHDTDSNSYRGEVVPLYPSDPRADPKSELYVAVAQVRDGANLAAGIPRLRRVIERERPSEAGFYLELADAYRKQGRAALSIPYYQEALRRKPQDGVAMRNLGAALTSLGRAREAVAALSGARDAESLNALGAALIRAGRPADAVPVLRRAVALDADLPEAFVNLGTAISATGDATGPVDAFERAVSLQPDLAVARDSLARALVRTGLVQPDAESAMHHYRRAIWANPDLPEAHFNLALALARSARTVEAKRHLEAVVRLSPGDLEAHYNLGRILHGEGRPEAAEHLRKAAASRDLRVRAAAEALLRRDSR
jgi:tetratricopeptide (TPR) repeat protein